MTPNLIDAVSSRVSPDMIGAISRDVGISPADTATTVRRSIPSIFLGLISGSSTEAGASRLLSAATEAQGSVLLSKLGGFGAGETHDFGIQGQRMLGSVFGDRQGAVANAISQSGGPRPEIVTRILAFLAPVALAALGKEAISRRLNAGGVAEFLGSHKRAILENPDLPRGLVGALGLQADAPEVSVTHTPETRRPIAKAPTPKIPWGWVAAILGALLLVGLFLMSGARRHEVGMQTPTPPTVEQPALPSMPVPLPAPEKPTSETQTTGGTITLPDWNEYKFNFQFASTEFAADSEDDTLMRLAAAMKANPDARIQLVGHTDAVGSTGYNELLGTNRAETVKQKLVDRGIDGDRIDVATDGKSTPLADNATDDGRAENRRVEVRLMSK